MKIRVSLLMIVLLLMQMVLPGVAPLQTASSEKDNVQNELFDFSSISEADYVEDGESLFVNVDWSLEDYQLLEEEVEKSIDFESPLKLVDQETHLTIQEDEELDLAFVTVVEGELTVTFNEVALEYPEAQGTVELQIATDIQEEIGDDEPVIEPEEDFGKNAEGDTEIETEDVQNEIVEEDTEIEIEEEATEEIPEVVVEEVEKKATADLSYTRLNPTQDSTSNKQITENLITGVTLSIDGEELVNGTEITVDQPYNQLDIILTYDFALPNNHGYVSGQTYTIEVPEMFDIPHVPVSDQGLLERSDKVVFASYYTEGNNIIITFNENIENQSNIEGEIILESNFDENYDGLADGDKITFPLEDGTELKFPIKFIPNANVIDKSGIGNKQYNTNTITWTVDINKNLQEIENATLNDVIGDGDHSFVEGSLEVYELVINADGSVREANEVTNHRFGSEFPLNLGNIESAYRFVYQTEINDITGVTYQNEVTLDGDNVDPSTTSATVGVTRGQPLEKTAADYNDVSQTITWEVKYNYDEKNITQEQAKLKDIFGHDNQQLVENSFEVVVVDIDPDTGEPMGEIPVSAADYKVIETADGFELQFNDDIDRAYKITYQTTVIYRVDGDVNITNSISDEFGNDRNAGRLISQGIFIKSHGSTNYEAKETNWSILVNRDEQLMSDVVITDILPVGFTPKNIRVTHDGNEWADSSQYDYSYDPDTRKITFDFNEELTKRVVITYTTDIDFDLAGRNSGYTNRAYLEWIPEGETDKIDHNGEATFDPNGPTQNNGFKHGSYNMKDKEITWTIGVNYNKETLENVNVQDFILGEQNFDINHVKVYKVKLTSSAPYYERGTEVTDDFPITEVTGSNGEEGFNVVFNDIDSAYIIQYTTDLNDQNIVAAYENNATVSSDNKADIELYATVNPTYGGQYVNKSGAQNTSNGRIVNWSINLNFSQSTVNNYQVVDTLSINQTILRDSFKVYETEVNPNSITKTSTELTEGTDYEIVFAEDDVSGQEFFTLIFLNQIDRAYVLEYNSYILYEGEEGTYSNSAKISGKIPGDEIEQDSNNNESISFNNISGSIRGEVGSLQVTKVDADDDSITLEGAVFELWDQAGNVLLKTAETDENGVATFTNLLYADYQLKETEAPEFYVVGIEDQQQVTVEGENSGETTEITIENEKIKQHFELTKVDDVDKTPLEGVEFELYTGVPGSGTYTGETFTTNVEGKILIEHLSGGNADEGLPAGDYYLIETAAKEHYKLDAEPITFTITQDQTVVTTRTTQNELTPGSLVFEKVDSESGASLQGAVFNLEYLDYNGNKYNTNRTLTTDANGKVEINDLRPGNYRLTEQTPPRGYEFTSDINKTFTIEESQTTAVDLGQFENNVKTTNLVLTKVDAAINSIRLEGVEFTLSYTGSDYTIADLVETTDKNGQIIFKDLKPGTYELVETGVPSDYGYIADATPIPVTVTIDDVHSERNVTQTVENAPFRDVVLTKVDSESNTALAGAEFELRDASDNVLEVEAELTTNSQGQIRITGLPAGDYKLVETSASTGYDIGTETEYPFTVNGTETSTESVLIEAANDIIKGSVEITKVDAKDNNITLDDVEFTLENISLVNGGSFTTQTGLTTDFDGKLFIDELRPGRYRLTETTPHEGYQLHWRPIEFTINLANEAGEAHEFELTVENYELVDIEVTKEWEDNFIDANHDAERPEEITVTLLQNGMTHRTQTINASSNWTHTFEGLDAVDSSGSLYTYTVEEQTEAGYISVITGDVENGFEITNTAKTTSLELTKVDSINRQLLDGAEFTLTYPDGKETQTETTDEDGQLTFEGLQPGVYTLRETTPPAGYIANTDHEITVTLDEVENSTVLTRTIENDPFANVTLTKVDAETGVALAGAIFKVVDADDNDVVGFTELEVESDGTLSITGLPAGSYKLVETTAPTGYALSDDEIDFTVTAESDTKEIKLGNFNNDIIKGSVRFTKLNDDNSTLSNVKFLLESTSLVNDDNAYSKTHYTNDVGEMLVNDLRPGEYKFTEVYPEGYQHYTGEDLTFTIDPVDGETDIDLGKVINYQLVDIEVTKVWLDNNATNDRPNDDGITIELYRKIENGSKDLVKSVELTEDDVLDGDDNIWTHTFEDLPAVDEYGNLYTYSIEELEVTGYTSSEPEPTADGFKITNLRTGTIDVTGEKTWTEVPGGEQYRPDSITVNLLANGEPTAWSEEVTAEEDWEYSFTDLDQFDEDGKEITYTVKEDSITGYTPTYGEDNYNITNKQETISISGTKTWKDNGEDRPETPITVQVMKGTDVVQEKEITSEENTTFTFTDLPKYDKDGNEIGYTINELPVPGYSTDINGYDITNTRSELVDVRGAKTWKDDNSVDRPAEIIVQLFANDGDEPIDTVAASEPDWEYAFTGLPGYDENGIAIAYTVTDDVAGYEPDVNGYDITNVRTGKTEVSGRKIWLDDLEEHPSITVELFANDTKVDEKELDEETGWSYEFTDLDKYDEEGIEIVYTVDEAEVPVGYEKSIDDDFNITNRRVGTTSVEGEKIWLDDLAEHPSITVELFANDNKVDEKELDEETGWTYAFTGLDKYDDEGIEITYTVDEKEVPEGYQKSIEGNDITNLRVGTTEVEVTKLWQDEDENDRPDIITINLLQNDIFYEEHELSKEDEWNLTISYLPKYDEEGIAYTYTVEEHDVSGYASEVDGFEITNTRAEVKSITINKAWLDDDESADRPELIEVDLFRSVADGEQEFVDTYEVTGSLEAANWSLEIEGLPSFDHDGKAYTYEIEEKAVEGYETSVNGFRITNLRVGETKVEGKKTWLDNNDATGDRPEEIDVILFQNDVEIDRQTVSANSNWGYSFIDLAEFDDQGVKYSYSVAEELADEVRDLYEEISEPNSYDLINRRVGLIDVDVTKTWQDDDLTDRPEAITVNLLQNGIVIDTQNITAEMDWSFSFTELAEFDEQGVAYEYTISEHVVPGYQSVIDGYEITNTRSELKSITVTKSWLDNDSSARPNEITVDLLANGEIIQTVQITAATDWAYQFENLPAYDEQGKAIVYSIMEHEVEGYKTTIDGFDITNRSVKEDATDGLSSEQDNEGQTMPKTATAIYNTLLISLVFLLAGVALFIINKRRNRSSN